jgi:hypothetical protein
MMKPQETLSASFEHVCQKMTFSNFRKREFRWILGQAEASTRRSCPISAAYGGVCRISFLEVTVSATALSISAGFSILLF